MNLSDLQYLMHQLGPATPEIITIVQEAIDSWRVEFDEGVSLQIAWDERSERVVMQCALGQPDDISREKIYASLLSANLLLTGVADVKLALSHVDDDVMLIGEYDIADASVDSLRQRLAEFLGFAGQFSRMIAGVISPGTHEDPRTAAGLHHDRV